MKRSDYSGGPSRAERRRLAKLGKVAPPRDNVVRAGLEPDDYSIRLAQVRAEMLGEDCGPPLVIAPMGERCNACGNADRNELLPFVVQRFRIYVGTLCKSCAYDETPSKEKRLPSGFLRRHYVERTQIVENGDPTRLNLELDDFPETD